MRKSALLLALVTVVAVALSGCDALSGDDESGAPGAEELTARERAAAKPDGAGDARCDEIAIAYVGTINGANAELGRNIIDGVTLAVNRHNGANKNCQVEFQEYETEGDVNKARGIVRLMAAKKEIVGVVGPAFSSESRAVGATFEKGGLVQVTPSATSPSLAEQGWKTFFRAVGNDAKHGSAAANFLTGDLEKKRICVVYDDSEYGEALASAVKKPLGEKLACDGKVSTGQTDFAAIVKGIKSKNPDAVYFAGYYSEAAPFAKQLREAGVDAQLVASDGVKDEEYVRGAGKAAAGTYFTCPCAPDGQFTGFRQEFQREFGTAPGTYAVEGYDAATVLLTGIDAGNQDREKLLSYVHDYDGQGLSNKFEWDEHGELAKTSVWTYRVKNGTIVRNAEIK